jgi:hypothetical protein
VIPAVGVGVAIGDTPGMITQALSNNPAIKTAPIVSGGNRRFDMICLLQDNVWVFTIETLPT